jgi:hypothetical protein
VWSRVYDTEYGPLLCELQRQLAVRQLTECAHLHALQRMKQWYRVRDDGANDFESELEVGAAFEGGLRGRAEDNGTAVVEYKLS